MGRTTITGSSRRKRSSVNIPEYPSSQEEDFGAGQREGEKLNHKSTSSLAAKSSSSHHHHHHHQNQSQLDTEQVPQSLASAMDETKRLVKYHDQTKAIENESAGALQRIRAIDELIFERFSQPRRIERFNLGGQQVSVPLTNLKYIEGSFFDVLTRGDLPVQRDNNGCIFIDRDPEIFKIIMNYARGYTSIPNLTLALAHRILCDAEYYQLEELSETMRFHIYGTSPSQPHQLSAPGAGINPDRNRFKTVYNVTPLGDRLLLSGRHSVTFEIKKAEYVGLGVISDECTSFDSEFHRVRNSCVYYMTGIIYTNFPIHKKEDNAEKFVVGDFITINLDMWNHVVEFRLRNSIKCFSCSTAVRLRFAVVMKFDSEVALVGSSSEENTQFVVCRN